MCSKRQYYQVCQIRDLSIGTGMPAVGEDRGRMDSESRIDFNGV